MNKSFANYQYIIYYCFTFIFIKDVHIKLTFSLLQFRFKLILYILLNTIFKRDINLLYYTFTQQI